MDPNPSERLCRIHLSNAASSSLWLPPSSMWFVFERFLPMASLTASCFAPMQHRIRVLFPAPWAAGYGKNTFPAGLIWNTCGCCDCWLPFSEPLRTTTATCNPIGLAQGSSREDTTPRRVGEAIEISVGYPQNKRIREATAMARDAAVGGVPWWLTDHNRLV